MKVAERPLAGKRIVITRSPEQSGVLLRELEGSGATVILLPCVEFRLPSNTSALDSALARLSQFDWVVFTSPNGVRFFCQRLRELGREASELSTPLPLVAAIGVATASAATKEGLAVEFALADVRSGREFAERFSSSAIHGKKILLPQSDLADGHIAEGLKESGAARHRSCGVQDVYARIPRRPRTGAGEARWRGRFRVCKSFGLSKFRQDGGTGGTQALCRSFRLRSNRAHHRRGNPRCRRAGKD